jgi:hypothetical protein
MTEDELKYANMLFWQIKGHLIPLEWSVSDIQAMKNSYFSRLWGNHESSIHLEGFEEAWQKRVCSSQ